MSEFTQVDAEALGWLFVHEQQESKVDLGDGISRFTPGSFRAEKYQNGNLLNEEGESKELLLERILLYEEQLGVKRVESDVPAPAAPDAGVEVEVPPAYGTVHTAEGVITEEELASRSKHDVIYDGEKTVNIYEGKVIEPPVGAEAEQRAADEALEEEPEIEDVQPSSDVPPAPAPDNAEPAEEEANDQGGESDAEQAHEDVAPDNAEEPAGGPGEPAEQ